MTIDSDFREDLIFIYNKESQADFLNRVIDTGGWPYEYEYVQFYHAVENKDRYCRFTNISTNNEMWTTICCADDFYEFMLSSDRKREIEKRGAERLLRKIKESMEEL